MNVSLDLDEVEAIYEIRTKGANGRIVEVDVDASGKVEELEIEVRSDEVPSNVVEALMKHVPAFALAKESTYYDTGLRRAKHGVVE